MKKLALAGLVAAALTTACNQTKTTETATTSAPRPPARGRLHHRPGGAVQPASGKQQSRLDPLSATAQGDNRYNDQLPNDQTQAFRDTLRTFYQDYLTRLRQV